MTLLFLGAQVLFGFGVGAAPGAHAQTLNNAPKRLRLDIDTITPRVVRADTKAVTVVGSLTNIGDRRITNLIARLELGGRLSTDSEAHAALRGPLPSYQSTSPFVHITKALRPGQSTKLRLRVPLDGSARGLAIPRAGVYPLLVNVNGTPDHGGPARLVAANLLMPALAPPGNKGSGQSGDSKDPTGLSVLWPITARKPPVVRDTYGKPLVLADDRLAKSLAPGGRLFGLVDAASSAQQRGRISASLCFALDPALLETVRTMTKGYRVRTSGGLVGGAGVEAAKQWLTRLRSLVEGRCVIRMPYADANLNSLPKINSAQDHAQLVPLAVNSAATIKNMLRVQPLKGVLWPGNPLSEQAASAAKEAGVSTVLTSRDNLPLPSRGATGTSAVTLTGSGLRAQAYDPLLHRALRQGGAMADVGTQNGIGALVFRIRQRQQDQDQPILLAPPHRWNVSGAELHKFVRILGDFTAAGMIKPVSLQKSLSTQPATESRGNTEIVEAASELGGSAIATLSEVDSTASALTDAMSVDATSMVRPEQLVRPLRQAVLRACSGAWRDNAAQRDTAVRAASAQVRALTSRVHVTPPSQPIALASDQSPLPVYITNDLPVTVTVRISLLDNAGLRPQQVQYQTIPANSSRNRNINIDPLRAGHITVTVKLSTPSGVQLGDTVRFELVSTEYGFITVVVTATAAGALLLLSGRRIYRRVKRSRRG